MQDSAPPDIKPLLDDQLDFAAGERDIPARFGRIPHRNPTLGCAGTEEELQLLVTGKRFRQ